MKPLSYIYSYINIPEKNWNDTEINIWLFNGLKEIGISALKQHTKLIQIENHQASLCEDVEYIKAVVIRQDYVKVKEVKDYEVDENGNILIPNGTYPVVQQTVNNQVSAIYPLLPVWFPNNQPTQVVTWFWAEPKNMLFQKVCKECPTYCNDCAYTYSMMEDGSLYFPEVEKGVACVCYMTIPECDEILIDESNQYLLQALKNYVMAQYWETQLNLEYTQQTKAMFEYYSVKASDSKRNARKMSLLSAINIRTIAGIMTPTKYG